MRGPAWSPDGKRIVAILDQRRNRVLAIRSLDGTEARDLDTGLGYFLRPHWAPDGSITVQGLDLKGHKGIFRLMPTLVRRPQSCSASTACMAARRQDAGLPTHRRRQIAWRDSGYRLGQERKILESGPRFDMSRNVSPNGRLLARRRPRSQCRNVDAERDVDRRN